MSKINAIENGDTGLVARQKINSALKSVNVGSQFTGNGDDVALAIDKTALGINNVNNTSDANKPISTAVATALSGKVDDGVLYQPTNPFGGVGVYISPISNAFYKFDTRYKVLIDGVTSAVDAAKMFDGNYESNFRIPASITKVITLDFNPQSVGYPYGDILVSFYNDKIPLSLTARVYTNFVPHTVGWHNMPVSHYKTKAVDGGDVIRISQNKYNISKIEITITAPSTHHISLTQIEMSLERAGPTEMPFVSKYAPNTLYDQLNLSGANMVLLNGAKYVGDGSQLTDLSISQISDLSDIIAKYDVGNTYPAVTSNFANDLEVTTSGLGIILADSNGVDKWRVSISNGALEINKLT